MRLRLDGACWAQLCDEPAVTWERTRDSVSRGRPRLRPSRQWKGYESLTSAIEQTTIAAGEGAPEDAASSALAHLLTALENAWRLMTGGGTAQDFTDWLERTVVTEDPEAPPALLYLDSLDTFLLAAIHEIEELRGGEVAPDALEGELIRIWQRTYAFAASREVDRLQRIWLGRGKAIKDRYPDATQRRRIYKTSLSPRSAVALVDHVGSVKAKLLEGTPYAVLGTEDRFIFVREVLALLSEVPSFRIATRVGQRRNFTDWPKLLRWWLAKDTLPQQPLPREITSWYDFVAQNFIYRGAWGLGSVIGLLLDLDDGDQPMRALEIADWPHSGLPWIAFWLKELITWGTLDPVAAFLLARGNMIDRQQAETEARLYYAELSADLGPNDVLDPRSIRDWVDARHVRLDPTAQVREFTIDAVLERERGTYIMEGLTVLPLDVGNDLTWIDPAGYTVARSLKPADWPEVPASYHFELNVPTAVVVGTAYLSYA